MKKISILPVIAAGALASAAAFATPTPNAGFSKWEQHYDKVLCKDYSAQFQDATRYRGMSNVPYSAEKAAGQGEQYCHAGKFSKGDKELTQALTKLHLSPVGPQVGTVD